VKKRKLTKKQRKAQRAAARGRRLDRESIDERWDRAWNLAATRGLASAGPRIVEVIHARDRKDRADDLTRWAERWPTGRLHRCVDCAYCEWWPADWNERDMCTHCGEPTEAFGAVDHLDNQATAVVRDVVMGSWLFDHVTEWRGDFANEDFDMNLGPSILVEWWPDIVDGVDRADLPDPITVDWVAVANEVGAWQDQHPREIDVIQWARDLGYLL
jgi:hypothetical protein